MLTAAMLGGLAGGAFAAPGGAQGGTCGGEALATGECEAANLISQEDFDRVHAILEQTDAEGGNVQERIRAEREEAGSLAESARGGLEELRIKDLPGRIAEFADQGDLEGGNLPFSPVAEDGKAGVTHTLLLSESIPASQRKTLLKEAAKAQEARPDSEVAVYFQGPLVDKDIDETVRQFSRWLKEADLEHSEVALGINNKVFDRHGVEAVPTWVSERGGELVAKASGLGDLDYVLEQAEEADEPDIGRRGNVWSVAEPHFVEEYVKTRIQDWIEEQGGKEAIIERGRQAFWEHQEFHEFELEPAEARNSYVVDPSVTVTEDITVPGKDRLIARKGQRVNPLSAVPWTRPLLIFDGSRPQEVEWASDWLEENRSQNPILVTSRIDTVGDGWANYRDLTNTLGHHVYLLPKNLRTRLGIQKTPSVIRGTGDRKLRVTEFPVEKSLGGFLLPDSVTGWMGRLYASFPSFISPANAQVSDAACPNGSVFSRMFSDVCWDCHIPFSVAGQDLGGDAPNGFNRSPVCMCEPPFPGVTMGAWLPSRLVELVRTPGCSPTMFGSSLTFGGPGMGMQGGSRERASDGNSGAKTFYHYHYWAFPAGEILGTLTGCVSKTSLDMMYVSEMDPTWNEDQISVLTTPEAALFANPIAQSACVGEAMAVGAGVEPIETLYWCAGAWGSMYPFTGNLAYQSSPISDTSLLAVRSLAALHRRGLARDFKGNPCDGVFEPMIPKNSYRWSQYYPVPESNNTHWTGQAPVYWGPHRTIPGRGEDYIHMLWRWTDCCLES
ncbi:TrbC family F-type conjugative pilus assembly protein [Thiohalospira halophila]|uniref:TrbC family F-type conjugative pilus assembly protein n=1 Tax=Thiohalospira halophila TaxID=381300 RepID=UPI0013567237|nr:TrbC family F-type conjugative pilus assembly protein [Thiohalospira halophila]